jgi:hypothetical protein
MTAVDRGSINNIIAKARSGLRRLLETAAVVAEGRRNRRNLCLGTIAGLEDALSFFLPQIGILVHAKTSGIWLF